MLCLAAQSCPTLCDPMDWSPPGYSIHVDCLGKNTGVGCHALLQGIFPTQGSNAGLPDCRQVLYCLHYQGSPFQTRETCNFLFFRFLLRELQNHHLQVDYFVSLLHFESTSVVNSTSLNLCSQHRDEFTCMLVFSTDLVP